MTWQYISGFFDGEGSLTKNKNGFRITVPQTNEKVLKEIRKFVGFGNIIMTRKRKIHWKDNWVYYIAKQKDILFFSKKIYPFVIIKKKHILENLHKLKYIVKQQNIRKKSHEKRLKIATNLRSQGFAYWKIGLKMGGLDRGYIRRLILSGKK